MSDYRVIHDVQENLLAVSIVDGPFKGMICSYGKVGFTKIEESDQMQLNFDYGVIENKYDCDADAQELIDFLGKALIEILDKEILGRDTDTIVENAEAG